MHFTIFLPEGIMAGAPCPVELVHAMITELSMENFVVMYGMTECFSDDSPEIRSTTIGFPSNHTEVG